MLRNNRTMKQFISLLFIANLALFLISSCKTDTEAEKVTTETTATAQCYSGGPGTSTCEVPAGIDINGETTIGCSVTCDDGYYACCSLRCICIPES